MWRRPEISARTPTALLHGEGQDNEVEIAAISGDGQRILTVRDVGTAEIWDAQSTRRLGQLQPQSRLVSGGTHFGTNFRVFIESAALNRDGTSALLGLNDGTAGLYRISDGVRLAVMHPPGEVPASAWRVIRAVAFSEDGSLVLVGFFGRAVGVWSEDGRRLVAFLESPVATKLFGVPMVRDTLVSSIAISADNRRVFAGSTDMIATIWDLESKQVLFAATEHAEDVLALYDHEGSFGWATSAGTIWCATDEASPTRSVVSEENWKQVRVGGGHFATLGLDFEVKRWDASGRTGLIFKPDENLDRVARWRARIGPLAINGEWVLYRRSRECVVATDGINSIEIDHVRYFACLSPTRDTVAVCRLGHVQLWSIPGGHLVWERAAPDTVTALVFAPDGSELAIVGSGRGGDTRDSVVVHEVANGHELHCFSPEFRVYGIQLSADHRYIAMSSDDVVLWDRHKNCIATRIGITSAHTWAEVRFLTDRRFLVLDEGRARVFQDLEQVAVWDAPVDCLTPWCVDDKGRILNVALRQAVARFDLDTGVQRGIWAAAIVRPEQLPSPELASSLGTRLDAALWRTEYGSYVHQSDGPRGRTQQLRLFPEGIVAIPAREGAAVLRIGTEVSLHSVVPFEGKLRASHLINGKLLLVNEHGQLFRHDIE